VRVAGFEAKGTFMNKKGLETATQFAALPWRVGESGTREVLLLTSRETGRWVIPKGWPMKGEKPHEVARREAYEEAGLVGHVPGKRPLGSFQYEKTLNHRSVLCEVKVFALQIERQLDEWPEKAQRETKWFDARDAASLVDEAGLGEIINAFAGSANRFVALRKSRAKPQ
jgi:8-oxo-dGTP pyrophosphatase MutT (NUDIX family)